ncbi:Hypothetical protein ORPV_36 [Orpheovirus IHUMI-LCC2]|uniref:Uncharacterized protein n=1 Tax=Orpheovirus IHUMI-LCC2 TaxID=2023057 RepID=A0A2I2L355_9VIRU|nr:Hypothetical protein ORPV_36 [Orpheovirus IHUMI-LCC2]SNW61940.1 Hypothetical protein ORPV_36 [Orpheovirus IHUMI-LCC2]
MDELFTTFHSVIKGFSTPNVTYSDSESKFHKFLTSTDSTQKMFSFYTQLLNLQLTKGSLEPILSNKDFESFVHEYLHHLEILRSESNGNNDKNGPLLIVIANQTLCDRHKKEVLELAKQRNVAVQFQYLDQGNKIVLVGKKDMNSKTEDIQLLVSDDKVLWNVEYVLLPAITN